MATATLRTDPYTIQQGSAQTMPWDIDFSAHLAVAETIGTPTATLEDLATGAAYPAGVLSAAAQSTTVVRVTLQALVKGHRYRLVTRCVVSATKTPAVESVVEVVF